MVATIQYVNWQITSRTGWTGPTIKKNKYQQMKPNAFFFTLEL